MRYKFISTILPENQRLESTIHYYENIKNLSYTRRDPLFWLQYAIASLNLDQLERAERYFEDSYSLAKARQGYDTFQIDNHFSRLLLEKALRTNEKNASMKFTHEAKIILLNQMKQEHRYYPYRSSLGFFKVYDKHKDMLSKEEKDFFASLFSEIYKRSTSTNASIRNNRYVVECSRLSEKFLVDVQGRF